MKEVTVPKTQSSALVHQLSSLYETFKDVSNGEKVNFNLSKLDWTCPLLILPISAYIKKTGSKFTIEDRHKIKTYLDTVNFPKGISSVSSFQKQTQLSKSYIPISELKKEKEIERERLEALFSQMVFKTLKAAEGTMSVIYYPITELTGNIFEHSKESEGYIFGQFYPKKDYLDICIVDNGRGLSKTYEQEKGLKLSDEASIMEAMSGNSTKSNRERGFGLRTSKRVVCEGLGGGFILISGDTALVSIKNKENIIPLPDFNWQGVIVAYRIPRPDKPIAITPYLE